jgi:hypothetical protein
MLFVPDLLHEFELGVWKATFTHLIRILYARGGDMIQALNIRYVVQFESLTTITNQLDIAKFQLLAGIRFENSLIMPQE